MTMEASLFEKSDIAMWQPIDCDIHPALPNTAVLVPYLDDYWREHVLRRGIEGDNLELSCYPIRAPINARPDWSDTPGVPGSDYSALKTHLLDHFNHRYAICNVLHGSQIMFSEDLSAALCRAINRWIVAELLDRDPRLRASIVVPVHSPELAAEEIERCSVDKRFVQVLLLAMAELPLGRRQYWPIYKAAEKHGLPVGIHAGTSFRHPPTAVGWPSYYLEDYVNQASGIASALTSLISEGVFVKFPDLKVVLLESGVTWLPNYMWRLDKTWRGIRAETPWLDRLPSAMIRSNVRLSTQPFDDPGDPAKIERLIDQIKSDEILLFSSDYPHWHFDGDDLMPEGLSKDLVRKIIADNPAKTYGFDVRENERS